MTAALTRTALLLSLLLSLLVSVSPQSTKSSVVYSSQRACDVATDSAGAVYVLLCGGGVARLDAFGVLQPSYLAQYNAAIAASTAYAEPLQPNVVRVSGSGTVWVLDSNNAQLVGVANISSASPSVSVISVLAEHSTDEFSIAPDSEALWLIFPGDASAPVQQLSPSGAVLQSWSNATVPGLNDFFPFGIFAAAGGSVYIGGCYPASVLRWVFNQGVGVGEQFSYNAVQGCDVRRFSANGSLLQTFRLLHPLSSYSNISFFTAIAVDAAGSVYAIDPYNNAFNHWASNGTLLDSTVSVPFSNLAITPSGVLYAAPDNDLFAVVTVSPTTLSVVSSVRFTNRTFEGEQAVTLSPDGRVLYTASASGDRILALNATTGDTVGVLGFGLLRYSQWLATGSDGSVYVSDSSPHANSNPPAVYKLSRNGSLLLTITGGGLTSFVDPQGVAVNPTTGELVVADRGQASLRFFSSTGAFLRAINTSLILTPKSDFTTNPSGYLYRSRPYTVAVSATGTIVYSDTGIGDLVIIPASGNATSLGTVVSFNVLESERMHSHTQPPTVPPASSVSM